MARTALSPLMAVVLLGGVALVSGCHKAPKKPPEQPAPAVVTRPSPPLPPRQPGLWQTTVTEEGSADAPQQLQICIDAATDAHLGVLGTDLSGDRCTRKTFIRNTDGSWGVLAECDAGNGTVTEYSGSISGDHTQDFTMKLRAQATDASNPTMNRVTNYTVVSKRTGDCAGDQNPGDIINDGVKMNLFDMAGIRTSASRAASADSAPPADAAD